MSRSTYYRNVRMTHLEREGDAESALWGARIAATTGVAPLPRGAALVRHVAAGIAGEQTAVEIAAAVGYRVERCAQILASAGHAPLARVLLARDTTDHVDAEWEAYKARAAAEKAAQATRQPAMTTAERLRELRREAAQFTPDRSEDLADDMLTLAAGGVSWADAAARCGYPVGSSAAKRLWREGRLGEVRDAFGRPNVWAAA